MKKQVGYTIIEFMSVICVVAGVLAIGGWVANVVKLLGMNFDHITGMLVVRAIGIFLAPLGAVVGFF